jgi:RND family efflux transporter MFP subunit
MRVASGIVLAFALTAGLLGCASSGPQAVTSVLAASEPAPAPAPRAVAATTPDAAFVASGPLLVEQQVDLAAQRPGVVAKILVDVGQPVRRGQLLAALDDRELLAQRDAAGAAMRSAQANLQDWQAETKMAQADFRRADAMFKAQLNTQEQLDHARYKWEGSQFEVDKGKQDLLHAQSALQAASLELEKAYIRAPFAGLVARRYVRLGEQVASGDRLFWITTVRPLQVKFTLPEKFITRVKRGQLLGVTCPDAAGVGGRARVVQVSPVVDPSSGTFEVVAQVLDPSPSLRPGMTANIRLENLK